MKSRLHYLINPVHNDNFLEKLNSTTEDEFIIRISNFYKKRIINITKKMFNDDFR